MDKGRHFYEGQMLKAIFWPDGTDITTGNGDCQSIKVLMEKGQMSEVPWALATFKTGDEIRQHKYNLAHAEGITLLAYPGKE